MRCPLLRRMVQNCMVFVLCGVLAATSCHTRQIASAATNVTGFQRKETYGQYLAKYEGAQTPDIEILIPGESFASADPMPEILHDPFGLQGTAVCTDEYGYIEWIVNVPQAGLYNIELMYYPVQGKGITVEREITINGEELFEGADQLAFHRMWTDSGPFLVDVQGNEIRPAQVETPRWRTVYLSDPLGYELKPYKFYFREGENKIRLTSITEPMAIAYLRLCQAEEPKPYSELANEYAQKGYKPAADVMIKIQGEGAAYRSSPSLFAISDQGDPTLEPYHPAEIRLNSIGGYRWSVPGDWITWEFTVPEDGLYQIAIKGKQDMNRGTFSNRRILIDGKVPCAELESVRFSYSSRYEITQLGKAHQDEPFLFYLTKGTHEITLEAVLGDLAPLVSMTEDTLYELTSIYRSIIMITSPSPDPLRTYQLDKRVPKLLERLRTQAEAITWMADEFERLTGQRGGHTATLVDIALMLNRMADEPDSIPKILNEYRDGIGNLGTWIMNTRNQPLQIDYIVVASPEQRMPRATPNFFEVMAHEIRAFIASFTYDYTNVGDIREVSDIKDTRISAKDDPNTIKVWIGLGRDHGQILKQMIEDSFTPETGIKVELELISNMGALLVPATIAGTHPDVALGAANLDLAFRGAVADLTQFEDFEEVASRFMKSALHPYRFRDAVWALPEVQSFPMLFYRKDVLAELGLEVPQTWDELLAVLPELQNHHLEFGMAPNMWTLAMLLYQQGVAFYKEDCIAVNWDSEAAIQAFKWMCELYTQSGLPLEYNFINRFRTGEMPLAIANYGEFNTLTVFAPELRGLWGMAPIPGTRQPDGTINRAASVDNGVLQMSVQSTNTGMTILQPTGATGSIILEKSTKKQQAWEFLKWWTRTDTQVRFGREIEALIGAAARWATANVEAMQLLPWSTEDRQNLLEQWRWIEGMPPVIGQYYVSRHFDWMFRAVVLNKEPLRESVLNYTREVNLEIERKRKELGYETDYEKLDDRLKELYWSHYMHVYRLEVPMAEKSKEFDELLERYGILVE
ncbi:MAG TPA: extracellular solute-binding protein [Bacillota bacterium]|nr:extracellular solute-binding protein [Bacillota bacterium]